MPIWEYAASAEELVAPQGGHSCAYCCATLTTLACTSEGTYDDVLTSRDVLACPCCGWWYVHSYMSQHLAQQQVQTWESASGVLRNLDLTDLTVPVEEIRSYLCANFRSRFDLPPRLLEETVASVFKSLGYRVRVTGRCGDGGIDVVLDGDQGDTVGVQVKRYRASIGVEQIRAFAGALLLGGYTKGVYVTTSRFQSGTRTTTERFKDRGIGIELLDAEQFYQALRISQRSAYQYSDDASAPFNKCKLYLIKHQSGYIEE